LPPIAQTAHQPAFDRETSQRGRERYEQFVNQAGRMLARKPGMLTADTNHKEGK